MTGLMDFVEWNEYYETWYKGDVEDMKCNLEAIHRAFPDKPLSSEVLLAVASDMSATPEFHSAPS